MALRVITDHGDPHYFPGLRRIIVPSPVCRRRVERLPLGCMGLELGWGLWLWVRSLAGRRELPVVTSGQAHGFVFASLQYLLGGLVGRRTHLIFDLLLDHPAPGGWRKLGERFKRHVFNRVVDRALIWGEADVERYARAHGLARERLEFHPFHTTLAGYDFEIRDDGYIFAGGNGARDYATLISALAPLGYPVFIATTLPGVADLARQHPQITVAGISPAEFRRKMAASTLVVECHDAGFFRTGGHQTFLNAFYMGKPFVMADRESARGYFEDGELGYVLDHGDAAGVRRRVAELLADEELRAQMGERARRYARQPHLQTIQAMQSIYNRAITLDAERRGYDSAEREIRPYA